MRVTVDLGIERIVIQPGVLQEVRSLDCKRSLQTNFEVQFTRNGAVVELPNDATGIFGIKDKDKFDGDYVAAGLAWVKTGSGDTTLYTFSVNFITVALDGLFFVDGNPNNDVAVLLLMAELQWQTGGDYFKSQTIEIRLNNDINRGGETVSPMPSIAYGVFLPEITRLEGGTSIDLDNVATIGLVTGYIIEVLVDVLGERTWLTYVLTAGPATEAAPGQVEPLDYDGMSNDRHWLGAVGPSGPAGVNAGTPYLWNTSTATTDPTAGKVKVNNATLASATELYISETDDNAVAMAAILATWDDGSSAIRGRVMFLDPVTPANFAVFDITGTRTDNGAWDTFTIAYVASGGTLTNNLPVQVFFFAHGDKGDQGDAGSKYQFNSATAGNPGTGKFLFNHATFLSATQLLISETDGNSNNLAALLASIDDGSSIRKCLVTCQKQGGIGYITFYVTGTLTDNGTYDTFSITPVSSGGSITNNDVFFLTFMRTGDMGLPVGNSFLWNTNTASSDPTSGKLKVNNASLASATSLFISETDFFGNAIANLLSFWTLGDSSVKGWLYLTDPANAANFAIYAVPGTVTDNGTWDTFAISYIVHGGTFTSNMALNVLFVPKGDKGDTGTFSGIIESFTYANAADRVGAVGLVPGDVGKIAFQSDDSSYWRLTDDSPVTWVQIGGGGSSTPGTPWKYSDVDHAATSPSDSYFKIDNGDGTAATALYISRENAPEQIWEGLLKRQLTGNVILIYPPGLLANDTPGIYRVTGAPTDNSGWFTIPIEFIDGFWDFDTLAFDDLVNFVFSGPISAA